MNAAKASREGAGILAPGDVSTLFKLITELMVKVEGIGQRFDHHEKAQALAMEEFDKANRADHTAILSGVKKELEPLQKLAARSAELDEVAELRENTNAAKRWLKRWWLRFWGFGLAVTGLVGWWKGWTHDWWMWLSQR